MRLSERENSLENGSDVIGEQADRPSDRQSGRPTNPANGIDKVTDWRLTDTHHSLSQSVCLSELDRSGERSELSHALRYLISWQCGSFFVSSRTTSVKSLLSRSVNHEVLSDSQSTNFSNNYVMFPVSHSKVAPDRLRIQTAPRIDFRIIQASKSIEFE